ncbi:DNA-binding transcriptional LysR family regulator [Paenibacillus shirakamiensis]|uniref:DNA-binding transcriptional LysR family regulator n=1 Tax=Paenibacillus shirakamiensis TaxID=1265935 RepID=A0ABS4JJN8_9BACL|nr:LysR family transcriptional regulator [Paenibacillus shirakamiensis]MBP2001919.1 DNA-binding transcriptional LysR family regulator [Paenibacillus shirakamiensis]
MDQTLLVFITVVDKGNFTRAAEELHMTQPAVSQHIQALERTSGARLLERTNKSMTLTASGKIVYDHARQIQGLYTSMQGLIDDHMHRASGILTIGASYTYGEYILPHDLALLRQQYPLIQPTIQIGNTKDIAEGVLNHQLNIGIVEGELRHTKLKVVPFAEDVMYVMVSANHSLAKQQEIDLQELKEDLWILREPGSGTREATDKLFETLGFVPKERVEFGSTQIIKESVEAGLGIALLSQWTVRKELRLGTLCMLQVNNQRIARHFSWVMLHTEYKTKAVEVFLEMLTEKELSDI